MTEARADRLKRLKEKEKDERKKRDGDHPESSFFRREGSIRWMYNLQRRARGKEGIREFLPEVSSALWGVRGEGGGLVKSIGSSLRRQN